jgi:hypothetical protein
MKYLRRTTPKISLARGVTLKSLLAFELNLTHATLAAIDADWPS